MTRDATSYNWVNNATTVHEVATWAVDNSQLTSLDELLYFFEKPWKFEELHEGWMLDTGETVTIPTKER